MGRLEAIIPRRNAHAMMPAVMDPVNALAEVATHKSKQASRRRLAAPAVRSSAGTGRAATPGFQDGHIVRHCNKEEVCQRQRQVQEISGYIAHVQGGEADHRRRAQQVSSLFKDHPDLLKEFAYFLPEAVQDTARAKLQKIIDEKEGKKKNRAKPRQRAKGKKVAAKGSSGKGGARGSKAKADGIKDAAEEEDDVEDDTNRDRARIPLEQRLPLLEKQFFKRIKAGLASDALWKEFLKVLELYSHELLSRGELLSLATDILSVFGEEVCEQLVDDLEKVLHGRGMLSEADHDLWFSVPVVEYDFAESRRW